MNQTVKEVAQAAGVSFSTVALAFRKPERVKAQTRERIFLAAERLGYKKNRFAAILSSGREAITTSRPLLGFLAWEEPIGEHQHWLEAKRWADRLNYELLLLNLQGEANPKRTLDIFYAQGGSGLFIGPVRGRHDLDLSRFVLVQLGRGYSQHSTLTVDHAVFDETVNAFMRLRERGYRAILPAIRRHVPTVQDDLARRGAILACQQGLQRNERAIPPLETAPEDFPGFIAAVRRFRPDAVLGFNRWDCDHLRQAEFQVPEKLGFAALHVERGTAYAGIVQDDSELMQTAYKLMETMLSRGADSSRTGDILTTVAGQWTDGPTLR